MKKNLRRIAVILTVILAIGTLTACGNNAEDIISDETKNEVESNTNNTEGAVSDETISVTLNKNYTLKDNLVSGTYKVVFTLYDVSEEVAYKQETDKNGNITEKPFNVSEYAYIGDTFSYIIIK